MDYDISIMADSLLVSFLNFYHSTFFLIIKVIIAIYLLVILADIVLLLILRNIGWHYRVGVKGADMPVVSKNKTQKRWDKIKERLESGNVSQYKVAIIEADAFVEEFLDRIGYRGENMAQKLEQVGEMQLDDHRETLSEVHKLRNRIVHEADFEIDRETAKDAVEVYEKFLKYLDFLG